ncbi:hypothetical protein KDL67_13490 [bacterium]|nr:hypothetical protein [bacterium]
MSRPGTRITQDPRVMALVLLVLAVMVAVNLREFLPQGAPRVAGASFTDEALAPPPDLARVTGALERQLEGGVERAWPAPRGDVDRNPFAYLTASRPSAARSAPAPRRSGPRLECTAIFVGNGPPAALVDGHVVSAGERVGGYVVESIGEKGVTLRDGSSTRFLPVEQKKSGGAVGAPISLR